MRACPVTLTQSNVQALKAPANALLQYIGDRVDISAYQIPVLVYKGSPAHLPDIFEKESTQLEPCCRSTKCLRPLG